MLTLGSTTAAAALVTGVLGANAWHTDSGNFALMAANGGILCPIANDVNMVWDGNAYNSSSDYAGSGGTANVTASSTAPFFGHTWIAHDIQVFTPGSYSFNVTLGGGNPETGVLSATVGSGQLGMHMLMDWNGNNNIDMFMVLGQNSIFGSGLLYSTQTNLAGAHLCDANYTGTITKNCLSDFPGYGYGSAGAPTKNEVWMLASVDGNGDGVMGIPMAAGGPFGGFSPVINTNLTAVVPLPAAVWLFGSGLMGLVAAARRRKST